MKRSYLSAVKRLAHLIRSADGLTAAVPYTGLRVVRLCVDELPDGLLISSSILEWAFGLLALFLVLHRRFNIQMEKDNASAS